MENITHSQVQELVRELPAAKLPLAYSLLPELAEKKTDTLSAQSDFTRLPLHERRKLMEQQAEQMITHYERTAAERREWQAGDFY